MKKKRLALSLFVMAGCWFTTNAQTINGEIPNTCQADEPVPYQKSKRSIALEAKYKSKVLFSSGQRKTAFLLTKPNVTDVTLGCAENVLGGFSYPGLPRLDYKLIGTNGVLTMIHRSGPNCTPSDGSSHSGNYMVDISKDGGATWNSAPSYGPMGNFNSNQGRYPGGLIYNPSGNANPDSAFISYLGPGLTGNNFSVHHTGAATIGNPLNYHQNTAIFQNNVNFIGSIPYTFAEDGAGTTWYIDMDRFSVNGVVYDDTLIIRKGIWNSGSRRHQYSTIKLPFPVITDPVNYGTMMYRADIAASGQTVYVSAEGNGDASFTAPDTSLYITVWKSIDGGLNWSAPYKINMDINSQMNTTGVTYDPNDNGYDGAIDNLGNYHMMLRVVGNDFADVSIITNGTSHTKTVLNRPQAPYEWLPYNGGNILNFTRNQIALSPDRSKVFYVWFDTDTLTWGNTGNNDHPNAFTRMYNTGTSSFDSKVDLTTGSVADGSLSCAFVANWASAGGCAADEYQIHLGYQKATTTTTINPYIFHYVGTNCITSVNEYNPNSFSISNIFPNPGKEIVNLELNLKESTKIDFVVTTILGQIIYTSKENFHQGENKLSIDVSKWNSGVYFMTLKYSDYSLTKKLVKE